MSTSRTPKTPLSDSASGDKAGSGPRRRSSQPALPNQPVGRIALERRASGNRAAMRPPDDLPPLEAPRAAAHDPELEHRIFMLVTAAAQDEGMTYPPAWASVVDAAKRRGYVAEKALSLHLTTHGKQWLRTRAEPTDRRAYEMTKIAIGARLQLKDLARDTGVPMQQAIGLVIGAIHEHRDELTRAARANDLDYPWEGIGVLLKSGARR